MTSAAVNIRVQRFLLVFLLINEFIINNTAAGTLKWTNINCQILEGGQNYLEFDYCYLKAIRRDYTEAFIKIHLYQLPIANVVVKMQLWRRANGYKPFLYNIEFDLCRLINTKKYQNTIEYVMFSVVKNLTTIKYTCPWDQTYAVIDHFGLSAGVFPLPVPSGQYRIDAIYTTNGVQRAILNFTVVNEE